MADQQELFEDPNEGTNMVPLYSNSNSSQLRDHLARDKHPQQELFICDVADAARFFKI